MSSSLPLLPRPFCHVLRFVLSSSSLFYYVSLFLHQHHLRLLFTFGLPLMLLSAFSFLLSFSCIFFPVSVHACVYPVLDCSRFYEETLFHPQDPVQALYEYMNEKAYRVIDLFKRFDADRSMSVTREEFAKGLIVSGFSSFSLSFVCCFVWL